MPPSKNCVICTPDNSQDEELALCLDAAQRVQELALQHQYAVLDCWPGPNEQPAHDPIAELYAQLNALQGNPDSALTLGYFSGHARVEGLSVLKSSVAGGPRVFFRDDKTTLRCFTAGQLFVYSLEDAYPSAARAARMVRHAPHHIHAVYYYHPNLAVPIFSALPRWKRLWDLLRARETPFRERFLQALVQPVQSLLQGDDYAQAGCATKDCWKAIEENRNDFTPAERHIAGINCQNFDWRLAATKYRRRR